MKRNTFIVIIIMSFLASIGIQILQNETNIGAIFGGAIALILGPYLITIFVKYLNYSFKWSFTEKSFLVTFMVTWCIFILLNIVGTI
jgi:nucleoside recognition membrane protein YjiH